MSLFVSFIIFVISLVATAGIFGFIAGFMFAKGFQKGREQ